MLFQEGCNSDDSLLLPLQLLVAVAKLAENILMGEPFHNGLEDHFSEHGASQ